MSHYSLYFELTHFIVRVLSHRRMKHSAYFKIEHFHFVQQKPNIQEIRIVIVKCFRIEKISSKTKKTTFLRANFQNVLMAIYITFEYPAWIFRISLWFRRRDPVKAYEFIWNFDQMIHWNQIQGYVYFPTLFLVSCSLVLKLWLISPSFAFIDSIAISMSFSAISNWLSILLVKSFLSPKKQELNSTSFWVFH